MSYHDYRKMLHRLWLLATAFLMLLSGVLGFALAQAQQPAWPDFNAYWKLKVIKLAGEEMTDPFWAHLHLGHPSFETVTLGVQVTVRADPNPRDPMTVPVGHQLRYTVHGRPISDWLDAPYTYVLKIDNPALEQLLDGIHDLNFELQGPERNTIRPAPMQLHLFRGRAIDPTVPILAHNADSNYDDYEPEAGQGPGVVYVNRADRHHVGYPVDIVAVPWHEPPYEADLYQEEMMPHTDLFLAAQMWWMEPKGTVSQGLSFVRGIGPKFGGDHRKEMYDAVYDNPKDVKAFGLGGHRNFPFKDGPRGVGWTSPFITGQVDRIGGLAFAETGGPLRYMKPDGELITVAGWRVIPGLDPVWILKPLNDIRGNMELRGTWLNGQYTEPSDQGFHYPTDVTLDPLNENIWYVAGFGDNVVWKVTIADRVTWNATVEVFAGSISHQPGYTDGTGTAARFNGPISLVFSPQDDVLYVADQSNNAIRAITRAGVVTTLLGKPDMGGRLGTRGLPTGITNPATGDFGCLTEFGKTECYDETANRTVAHINVSAAEAAAGMKHEPYVPFTVRVDSKGNLIILDMGYASISRVNPRTGEAKLLGTIPGRWNRFVLGWAWLDVDPHGNSGPLDGIYWLQGVASGPLDGEAPFDYHTNEVFAWLPPEGGQSKWLSGKDWQPFPDGWGRLSETDLPHYPWLVAVNPDGGIYLSGMGEHGITWLRPRKMTDPTPTDWGRYFDGKMLWLKGEPKGGASFSLKFGHEGHNFLGFADAWSLQSGVTDAELITLFEIPQSIVATPNRLQSLLSFIRFNSGKRLTTLPVPVDKEPPTALQGLTATTIQPTAVHLTWTASTDNVGIKDYIVERDGITIGYVATPAFVDGSVAPATTYHYSVYAADAAGNASPSTTLTLTTPPVVIPQPTDVSQTWQRNSTTLVCTATGLYRAQSLEMVDTCVKQFP